MSKYMAFIFIWHVVVTGTRAEGVGVVVLTSHPENPCTFISAAPPLLVKHWGTLGN